MTENVENLILERSRVLRSGQDRIEHDVREVQSRLSSLETAVRGSRRDALHTQEDLARQQVSSDHLKERIQRTERRHDLRDEAGSA